MVTELQNAKNKKNMNHENWSFYGLMLAHTPITWKKQKIPPPPKNKNTKNMPSYLDPLQSDFVWCQKLKLKESTAVTRLASVEVVCPVLSFIPYILIDQMFFPAEWIRTILWRWFCVPVWCLILLFVFWWIFIFFARTRFAFSIFWLICSPFN